jgi:hypothetical protein
MKFLLCIINEKLNVNIFVYFSFLVPFWFSIKPHHQPYKGALLDLTQNFYPSDEEPQIFLLVRGSLACLELLDLAVVVDVVVVYPVLRSL